MRTVVVGNRKLAKYLFRHMVDEGWNIVGALAPSGQLATQQANYASFDELAAETGCDFHQTKDINNEETARWLKDLDPDLCICGGWSQIITEDVLNIPNRGFLGFHCFTTQLLLTLVTCWHRVLSRSHIAIT